MGIDIHERRRRDGENDTNPARKAVSPQGEIGSWKGGQSRGKAIGDFYRKKRAKRILEGKLRYKENG